MKSSRLIIFGVLILDVISIGIMIPAFDTMRTFYNMTPWTGTLLRQTINLTPGTMISLGIAIYSLCAFFSAPVLGRLSDKYGRKKPLILCVIGTCLSYLLLLVTQNYWWYIASRIVNGLTGGNISIIQAILADISPTAEERNKNFGLLGAIFGIGFIIGPLLGTIFMKLANIETIFIFGALFSAIEVIAITLRYRETHTPDKTVKVSLNLAAPFIRYFSMKQISKYLWSYLILNTGIFLFQAVMTLAISQYFGVPGENIGYYLAVQGLLIAFNQGYLFSRFWTKKFTPYASIIGLHIVGMIVFIMMGFVQSWPVFVILWLGISPLSSLIGAFYTTEIIAHTDKKETGGINGILGSIGSITMIIGPLIGGFLLSTSFRTFLGTAFFIGISLIIMLSQTQKS
jgi:DHA1 family tetracycline resistance protein-like MFS transporter